MPATISVNFATQQEVENSPQPTNKSVSAKVLADVLGAGGIAGGYVSLATAQTITGAKTFSAAVTLNTAPTLDAHAATKKYVDDNSKQNKYYYNITSPTSTVSGPDSSTPAQTLQFTNPTSVDVYRNGVLLVRGVDYTANPAPTNSITFAVALAAGAVIQVNIGGVGTSLANNGVGSIQAGTGISLAPGGGTGAVTVGVDSSYDRLVPTGAIMAFGMNSAPSGWLICNGETIGTTNPVQGVPASLLQTLRNLLGTSHGVLGQLPDLRGIFVRGSGGPQTVGGLNFSGTFAAKQADAFRSHTHTGSTNTDGSHTHGYGQTPGVDYVRAGANPNPGPGNVWQTQGAGSHSHGLNINNQGGAETMPANIALLYCIKY